MAKPIVVLIEDSPTQAKAIAIYLSQFGIDVRIFEDGPPGLQGVAELQPSCVILDINLPTMNGYQIARHLRRNSMTNHIPLIMLTKNDSPDDLVQGLNNGADYYIAKGPDAPDELRKTLTGFGLIDWR